MNRWIGLLILVAFLVPAVTLAQNKAFLPSIQPVQPGQNQPAAPRQRQAPALPQITLTPPIPEVSRVEYASNGFIEVAHALVLVSGQNASPAFLLAKAQQVVSRVFAARAGLKEVDVSIYAAPEFAGFGGPPPRFTASVSKERLAAFERLNPNNFRSYDHLWLNPSEVFYGPPAPVSEEYEQNPQFQGSRAQLGAQRLEQRAASQQGGISGHLLYHGDPRQPVAALTFDDAPHPLYAPLLLDTLRRAGVKATFFCIGRNATAYPYFVRDMIQDGHEVGNHTFHHIRLNDAPEAVIRTEVLQTNRLLEGISGRAVRFFRPPGGRFSPTVLRVVGELN